MTILMSLLASLLVSTAKADLLVPPQTPNVKSGGGKVEFSENMKEGKDAAIRVVEANLRSLKACYAKVLRKNAQVEGEMVVKWEIKPNGETKKAQFEENKIRNWSLNDCVMKQFSHWKFPETSDGKIGGMTYSFEFTQKENAPPES